MALQHLKVEYLLEHTNGLIGAGDGVANRSGVDVDLVVVATLLGLVSEEVDVLVADAAGLLSLVLEVL